MCLSENQSNPPYLWSIILLLCLYLPFNINPQTLTLYFTIIDRMIFTQVTHPVHHSPIHSLKKT